MLDDKVFPQTNKMGEVLKTEGGMSLRDYFAGQALQGRLSASFHSNAEGHAKSSYEIADAMMKERAK